MMSKVDPETTTSIIGLVVEFIVAIDEARVRFTDDALAFFSFFFFWVPPADARHSQPMDYNIYFVKTSLVPSVRWISVIGPKARAISIGKVRRM